ncbi:thioredoxin domain-containing protein [Rhodococcoides fascians A21d2]|uniref:DsbA family protein n=1 Tax=Rhodococcoides fascians TaxID=1828 RepID=UPI0005642321|nr:thioredoxin domain-containing protein [Rhodococcus fascians]QII00262.1 thioredoxin domain-containing protein [Rhodococcus fascians A21d2]
MTRTRLQLTIVIALAFALVIGLSVHLTMVRNQNAAAATDFGKASLVTDEMHLLSTADDNTVTLVEFLDFECESCAALYPTMERIRSEYEGRITLGIRYFPLPSHTNSDLAARAVEAASRQGKLTEMYHRMFETQLQWGESTQSQLPLFTEFARDLGLDVDVFARDIDDPAVAARVEQDFVDGLALGVQGTPTLFLNDTELPSMPTFDELSTWIDAELER